MEPSESGEQRITELLEEGAAKFRQGDFAAALRAWDEALKIDREHAVAREYTHFVRANRIRLEIHRKQKVFRAGETYTPPSDLSDVPDGLIAQATSSPESSPGAAGPERKKIERHKFDDSTWDLLDAPAKTPDSAEAPKSPETGFEKGSSATGPVKSFGVQKDAPTLRRDSDEYEAISVEDGRAAQTPELFQEQDLKTLTEDEPAKHAPPTPETAEPDDAEVEIVIEAEEPPPAADASPLPPPPGAMDAPEMVFEAPATPQVDKEPMDFVANRDHPESVEAFGIERLAGPTEPDAAAAASPPPPSAATEAPASTGPEPDEAATSERKDAEPKPEPNDDAYADDAPTLARPPSQSTPAVSPEKAPLAGAGPKFSFGSVEFGGGAVGAPPKSSPKMTLAGVGDRVLFADEPDSLDGAGMDADGAAQLEDAAPGGDFAGEQSFSEDLPTTAREGASSPSAFGAGGVLDDYAGEQGSFSDDIPTTAREPTPADRARPLATGAPGDFIDEQGSFSDDIPTTAREHATPSSSPRGATDDPVDSSFSEEALTLERIGEQEAAAAALPSSENEEVEALLHPEKGLAMVQQLFEKGEYERTYRLAQQVVSRYPELGEVEQLLATTQELLEKSYYAELGDLSAVPVPDPGADLRKHDLDPRAAFLLTRMDGTMSLEDLIDISGMSRFDAARIILVLKEVGLIRLESAR